MRVFISSTYRDLAEHRETMRLALETSGYDFRGMEHFAADTLPPLDVCLKEVDNANIYVGIIGGRYGSCPRRRVLSYTELESLRAIKRGLYQIWLVLDGNADVKPDHIEQDPEKIKRLKRFRQRIERDHTWLSFGQPHEAAWKVLASLINYELRLREGGPQA